MLDKLLKIENNMCFVRHKAQWTGKAQSTTVSQANCQILENENMATFTWELVVPLEHIHRNRKMYIDVQTKL